jgi:SAM-dependent methyltransferase
LRNIAHFEELVESTRGDIQHFVLQAAQLLKNLPDVTAYLSGPQTELDQAMGCLDRPLVHTLLRRALLSEIDLELAFTQLRQAFLESDTAPIEHRGLIASVAAQCFNNNYSWLTTAREQQRLDSLLEKEALSVDELMISAMYRPLWMLLDEVWEPHFECYDPDFAYLLSKQVREPNLELELQQSMSSLGPVQDSTSLRVAEQYHESPYPRWFSIPRQTREVLSERLGQWCPGAFTSESSEILVPGCGTGQHPVHLASTFPDSQVTAMDLSFASLAYGKRRAHDFGLNNIEFWHGDLLKLSAREDWLTRFGFVDAVGVLHHLESPLAGCRALRLMMAPGGVVRVGLYSSLARREAGVEEARSRFDPRPTMPNQSELQESRRQLFDSPLTHFLDFFTLNGFRDLVFPAQEACFSITQAVEMLREAGLTPVGLQVSDRVRTQFQTESSQSSLTDWHAWDGFEQQNRSTFATMYNFLAVAA